MKIVKKIIDFVKKIFGQDISIKVEKKSKYDIKKNANKRPTHTKLCQP